MLSFKHLNPNQTGGGRREGTETISLVYLFYNVSVTYSNIMRIGDFS